MADVQPQFELFNETIRLGRFDENAILREKRDIIINKLRKRLKEVCKAKGITTPTFTPFDQGSYDLGIGTKPVNGDYDIDEGLLFDINYEDYPDPVVIKQLVHEALDGHTDRVSIKNPCVTVQYHLDGEPIYHVDLPVYAHDRFNSGTIYLSRGKLGSAPENKKWEISDPKGLSNAIDTRFEGDERKQFRRVIRYLKRWRDINFSPDGNSAPVGIGITVAGYRWFQPELVVDAFRNSKRPNDLVALRRFVESMLSNFVRGVHEGEVAERLRAPLPVQPYDDPFVRMTNNQIASSPGGNQVITDLSPWPHKHLAS